MTEVGWDNLVEDGNELKTEPLQPGELTFAEEEDVERAVQEFNALVARRGMELAFDTHAMVIGRWFGGDYSAFADPSRTKPASFRAFLQHKGLAASRVWIYDLVRIAEFANHLRSEVAHGLTPSHHRALLPVDDFLLRQELAERAFEGKLSVQDLKDEVVRRLPPPPPPEDKPQPRLPPISLDALRTTRQEFTQRLSVKRFQRDYARQSPAEQRRSVAWLTEIVQHGQTLLNSVEPREPE